MIECQWDEDAGSVSGGQQCGEQLCECCAAVGTMF